MFSTVARCFLRISLSSRGDAGITVRKAGYKSRYSYDTLYPKSDFNVTDTRELSKEYYPPKEPSQELPETETQEEFNGYIPEGSLEFKYTLSGGPGGQHVNKVNSKVQAKFHIDSADWIPAWIRPRLKEMEKSNITKDGYLLVSSDKTRKQYLNKADCLERIRKMIWTAGVPDPPPPSEAEIMKKLIKQMKANEVRIAEKRSQSLKKRNKASASVRFIQKKGF
ncbi:peptidyl-tRNA hydrolase ICT1, mitochondrial-like [Lingula anatina]|uniref:Large ribosomal subunit protein mL62 n=1 Tax=Lingula anatina TaxID=7574 RepID=A0A1S3I8A4_LINAN|nr:peptidyl-tRNA hydrolase ICT1, mitochondrial-like [Lingula anatina]|eukprot:XP_013394428.1 peptidyl-tRNA hydrolase ICT1, mitochondrial-like [Lingula anatina]